MGFFKKILGEDDYTEETEGAEEFYNGDPDSAGDFNAAVSGKPKAHFALVKPEGPENLFPIADKLLERKSIVLNLELVKGEEARRFVEFLSGVAYAMKGNVKKVAVNTYLIVPGGFEVSGEIFESIENGL